MTRPRGFSLRRGFILYSLAPGAKRKWLGQEIEHRGLSNVTLLNVRPTREDQIEFLNACDVSIISLVKGMWGSAMPSRTYNALAAGKPIVALTDEGSELALVIDEEQVGWHVPPGGVDALVGAVRAAAASCELEEMGQRAYAAALAKYSPGTAIDAYRSSLK